jgi:chemotaxis-related protein WspD
MHDRDRTLIDDCWNRIGIQGDRSCGQLDSHFHCRQCPVYASTAKTLLTRIAPSVQALGQTGLAAETRRPEATVPVLIFQLQAEWLGLPTTALIEVTPLRPVHGLPRRADPVLGVCNVRGRLIPCVSLSALLGLATAAPDVQRGKATARMLVVGGHAGAVVVPVDHVDGIHAIPESAIGPLPDTMADRRYARAVIRHRDRAVGLLDELRLVRAIEGSLG